MSGGKRFRWQHKALRSGSYQISPYEGCGSGHYSVSGLPRICFARGQRPTRGIETAKAPNRLTVGDTRLVTFLFGLCRESYTLLWMAA
jgi:hypothetical protein